MEALIGPKLVTPDGGEVPTSKALDGAQYVGLYFSAHWCPPCRAFTPKLSKYYSDNGQRLKLKVVFCSNDHDEKSFRDYFKEMSFGLALPFGDRRIESLSAKYKVEGIPTLIIVDSAGNTVATDVRGEIMEDPSGAQFPYKPKSVLDVLTTAKGYIDATGTRYPPDFFKAAGVDVLGIYFSAHWCGPCRAFTPDLAKWYKKYAGGANGKKLEIIFASSDRDQRSFDEYLREMPWKALTFDDRVTKEELSKMYGVRGIPTLVFIDARTGATITASGRQKVMSAPDDFPWLPKAVEQLADTMDEINTLPVAVLFTDKLTDGSNETAAIQAFTQVANEYYEGGKPSPRIRFAVASEGDAAIDTVRRFINATKDKDGATNVRLTIIDVPQRSKASLGDSTSVPKTDQIRTFVRNYLSGAGEREDIKK